jgi:Fibronectin type III-like domain
LTARAWRCPAGRTSSASPPRPARSSPSPVAVPLRALQHWDDTTHAWRTEPGTVDLHVGPSSGNLPLHTAIEIPGS